jgi:hypothetical protein
MDAPQPSAKFTVNNVLYQPSIAAGDVLVRAVLPDGSLGGAVNATGFSYDSVSRSISFTLPVTLADGNYRATLLAGSVSDTYGSSPAADYSFDFFFLAGDANHDRKVDITDLHSLAMNWGGSGKFFSQGDFNFDTKVDNIDLDILAARWQASLAQPAPALPASATGTLRRTPVRVVTLMPS